MTARILLTVLLPAAMALAASGCRTAGESQSRPNVLLVTVDTLRADHLGAYGYDQPTSPYLDALAARGTLFQRCMTSAPETAPGGASILTGLYQDQHLVTHNRARLPPDIETIAERFSAAGYDTAGFTGNFLLGAKFGFDQGFDSLSNIEGPSQVSARDGIAADRAIEWLETRRDGTMKPWFLWVHFMDPHGPYNGAPEELDALFDYAPGRFGDDAALVLGDTNFAFGVVPRYQRLPGLTRPSQYVRRYDSEIRFMDRQLGRLVEAAEAEHAGIIAFSADHGESLTEHDELFQHGWSLYETTLHVPLVVTLPGRGGPRVTDLQTSVVDIAPTLLDLASIEFPDNAFDGRSLARLIERGEPQIERPAFAYGPRDNHPFAIALGGRKLIHTPAGAPPEPGVEAPEGGFKTRARYELFDLTDDPNEQRNLYTPAEAADLQIALEQYEAAFSARFWSRKAAFRRR